MLFFGVRNRGEASLEELIMSLVWYMVSLRCRRIFRLKCRLVLEERGLGMSREMGGRFGEY